jgi:galactokinase
LSEFAALFGGEPSVDADAPGRVNLIGEHTDYNGGFVLPTAIPQRTRVQLAPRRDGRVRLASTKLGRRIEEYTLGRETPVRAGAAGGKPQSAAWIDYVQGVTRFLAEAGYRLGGFDALVSSTVPIGSGLSSSAALEVGVMRALDQAFGLGLDPIQTAQIGRQAENDFVGAKTGIMDQMAASLADLGTALFLDTRSLAWERVPLPPGAELVVIDSGVAHDHSAGDYNTRWAECERAAGLLGVEQLRDVPLEELPRVEALPEPLSRRARHVVTEDARVLEAVETMRRGDLARLGELFYASHASMRDDYAVSVPAVDRLVELAADEPDVYGARLTGGGFGGSIVALARAGRAADAAERVASRYAESTGNRPTVLVPPAALAGTALAAPESNFP